MIFVTQKPAGTVHPFLGTDARSKEQEERSLEQIGRSHPPSPRCWEPMGRSLEILNLSKEQTDRALERMNRSKEGTAHSQAGTSPTMKATALFHEGTNPTPPIPRASDADRDAIAALVQKCLDAKAADPDADVSELEAEIDRRVEFLYFHQTPSTDSGQAPLLTYDA
ncbi:MAG: hypothetical protein D8M22_10270 [Armatimonadetes bacterium]|nr:hypothetical protein [Armatimonadota bacterium]GIK33382.1 MAG: hypothetical protein BroJett009_23740 [Armatimonadota bacterium]